MVIRRKSEQPLPVRSASSTTPAASAFAAYLRELGVPERPDLSDIDCRDLNAWGAAMKAHYDTVDELRAVYCAEEGVDEDEILGIVEGRTLPLPSSWTRNAGADRREPTTDMEIRLVPDNSIWRIRSVSPCGISIALIEGESSLSSPTVISLGSVNYYRRATTTTGSGVRKPRRKGSGIDTNSDESVVSPPRKRTTATPKKRSK